MATISDERILIKLTRKQVNDFKHLMNMVDLGLAKDAFYNSAIMEVLMRADQDTLKRVGANCTPTSGDIVYVAIGAL